MAKLDTHLDELPDVLLSNPMANQSLSHFESDTGYKIKIQHFFM